MDTLQEDTENSLLPDQVYARALQLITNELLSGISDKPTNKAIVNALGMLEECLFLNMGRVLLPDRSGKFLKIKYSHGVPLEKRFTTYRLKEGISSFVYESGQPIYIDDLDTNSMYKGRLAKPLELPYSKPAFSGVPIKSLEGKVIGVLCVNHGYRNADEIKLTLSILEKTAKIIAQLLPEM